MHLFSAALRTAKAQRCTKFEAPYHYFVSLHLLILYNVSSKNYFLNRGPAVACA
jgi:hypothetical protein